MKLYGFPDSPNTWKVRAVIAHLGLPVEETFVDLMKGEQTAPSYLAVNPTGRTPTLVDGDFALWESTAIINYLASLKPSTLWPDDAKPRADIMRWQSWHLQHWGPQACEPLVFERLVKGVPEHGPADAAAVEKALQAFDKERAFSTLTLQSDPTSSATTLRSLISRSSRRWSMPRRQSFRSRPIPMCRSGVPASWRCRRGVTVRHGRRLPRPDAHKEFIAMQAHV